MRTNSRSFKVHQYLLKNPNTPVKDIAARFEVAASMVYKIRKDLGIAQAVSAPVVEVKEPQELIVCGTDIDSTLTDRGQRYGYFSGQAQVTQELKRVMSRHAAALNKTFTDTQWEALEMISSKIGRIVNGDSDHVDSWVDIAGYAKLVADQLQGIER